MVDQAQNRVQPVADNLAANHYRQAAVREQEGQELEVLLAEDDALQLLEGLVGAQAVVDLAENAVQLAAKHPLARLQARGVGEVAALLGVNAAGKQEVHRRRGLLERRPNVALASEQDKHLM